MALSHEFVVSADGLLLFYLSRYNVPVLYYCTLTQDKQWKKEQYLILTCCIQSACTAVLSLGPYQAANVQSHCR